MTTAEKIRSYREYRGFTQVQLAELSSINVGTIRKYELGIRKPKPEQLIKIANALCINVSIFYEIDVKTYGDVATLLFLLEDSIEFQFLGDLDNDKNYIKDTVSIKFKNNFLNTFLKNWADMKKALDKIECNANKEEYAQFREQVLIEKNEIYKKFKLDQMASNIVVTKDVEALTIKIKNPKSNQ